jgi:hypothetical protein
MKSRLCLAMLFLSLAISAFAQTASTPKPEQSTTTISGIDQQKAADIRRLMEVTGAGGLAVQMMSGLESSMKPMLEEAFPPGEYRSKLIELFFEKFRSKATAESIVTLTIPVYDPTSPTKRSSS